MPEAKDVRKIRQKERPRTAQGSGGGRCEWNGSHGKESVGQVARRCSGAWLQESDSVLQGISESTGQKTFFRLFRAGGVFGNQIKRAVALIAEQEKAIASQEKAIAKSKTALKELKLQLEQLQKMAQESENSDDDAIER